LHNVQTFSRLFFSRNEEIILTVPDDLPYSGDASVYHGRGTKQFRVPAIALDTFVIRRVSGRTLLKMDVEGAEYDVFMGAKENDWPVPAKITD